MSTTKELLDMLEDNTLSLRTDMLMFRLFDDCENVPASKDVIKDYIDRVCGYLGQHSTDIDVLSSALCERLEASQSATQMKAIA